MRAFHRQGLRCARLQTLLRNVTSDRSCKSATCRLRLYSPRWQCKCGVRPAMSHVLTAIWNRQSPIEIINTNANTYYKKASLIWIRFVRMPAKHVTVGTKSKTPFSSRIANVGIKINKSRCEIWILHFIWCTCRVQHSEFPFQWYRVQTESPDV